MDRMKVRPGNVTDLANALPMIKSKTPEKADLTLDEVLERLNEKDHHIKIAEVNYPTASCGASKLE